MQIYLVGGAVRDTLLGKLPKDRDYVVVGATVQHMLEQGFTQVGADFPVFLHPQTHEEYALARTERKSGHGYQGFTVWAEPSVTLEEDLARRDLTINSMAMTAGGDVIDPYGGRQDLQNRLLRHTSEAFVEDPLRVLRIARFLAKLGPDWRIAESTWVLMQSLVNSGELDHLTPERVWTELSKGLETEHPWRMVHVLEELNAWKRPSLALYVLRNTLPSSAYLKDCGPLARFALFFKVRTKTHSALPVRAAQVSEALTFLLQALDGNVIYEALPAEARLALLDKLDVMRQRERLAEVLAALRVVRPQDAAALMLDAHKLQQMSVGSMLAETAHSPKDIPKLVAAFKLRALQTS